MGYNGELSARYIKSGEAKKILKDKNVSVFIFKKCKITFGKPTMLKYPLEKYYDPKKINTVTECVWCSFNVENLKNKPKDFTEYIKLSNDETNEREIKIEYCHVDQPFVDL
jgi:hypothetical protein